MMTNDLGLALKWAVRISARLTVVSLLSITTMAVGIGLNTLVFSIVQALLLEAPPYVAPDRIVTLVTADTADSSPVHIESTGFNRWREETAAFDALAGYSVRDAAVMVGDRGRRIKAAHVSASMFRVLGVQPVAGRGFSADDESASAGDCVTVLSSPLSMTLFGVVNSVGQELRVDHRRCRVVGVLPANVAFPDAATRLWLPLDSRAITYRSPQGPPRVSIKQFAVVGRLRADVPIHQGLAEAIQQAGPRRDALQLMSWQAARHRAIRTPLLLLQAVVLLVLLIACANLAGTMLATGMRLQREIAVKAALGADRSRIVLDLMAHVTLLALAGGAVGVLLAWAGLRVVRTTLASTVPDILGARIDGWTLVFALGCALLCSALAGVIPALKSIGAGMLTWLKSGGSSGLLTTRRGSASWRLLIAAEVATTMALLVAALSAGFGLLQLAHEDVGYETARTGVVEVQLPDSYEASRRLAFFETVLERASGNASVGLAAVASDLPMSSDGEGSFSLLPPAPGTGDAVYQGDRVTRYMFVSDSYFQTMGIPILEGGTFDSAGAAPTAIVSAAVAVRDYGATTPVGSMLRGFLNRDWRVVGIAGNVKASAHEDSPLAIVYLPLRQAVQPGQPDWRLKHGFIVGRPPPAHPRVESALAAVVRTVNPDVVPVRINSVADRVAGALGQVKLYSVVVAVFAAMALGLASLGLFALLAHGVARRTREIGVRLALGAHPRRILLHVLAEGIGLTVAGLAAGLPAAWLLCRLIRSVVFGVPDAPLWIYAVAPSVLITVAVVASVVPALRAARVDPMVCLRVE